MHLGVLSLAMETLFNSELTQLAITAAGAILAYLLSSKLIVEIFNRLNKNRDKKKALNDTNAGKLIDADQAALHHFIDEVKMLKTEVKELREKLDTVNDERAELRADNKILKANEEHLTQRIERQSKRIETLEQQLAEMTAQMATLQSELSNLRRAKVNAGD